ncbi:MAG: TlpA family protein disulfide reductase [Myxococcales bacterium FL481]|nr:MAG: TlpA family protein disulfide reductase [Myxococcales bacterium FL481]
MVRTAHLYPLIVATALLNACTTSSPSSTPPDGRAGFRIDLATLDGDLAAVQAERDTDVLLLSFWKTTCTPCKGQLSDFEALHRAYAARGLRAYAVNIDEPAQRAQAQTWVDRGTWSFPTLVDADTQVVTRYNQRGACPFYVALTADGEVLRSHGGYVKGESDELARFLDQRLPPAPPGGG